MSNKRLIVALDTNNLSKAKEIVSHLNPGTMHGKSWA